MKKPHRLLSGVIVFGLVQPCLAQETELQFELLFGGSGNELLRELEVTQDGCLIACGRSASFNADPSDSTYDAIVLKLDMDGTILWTAQYGDPFANEDAGSIRPTPDGGYALSFTDDNGPYGSIDTGLLKLSATGSVEWVQYYGAASIDQGWSLELTPDGGYVIAGTTFSPSIPGHVSHSDYWVVRTDPLGNVGPLFPGTWQYAYGGFGGIGTWEAASDIEVCPNGGFLLNGVSRGHGHPIGRNAVLHIDDDGTNVWEMFTESGIGRVIKATDDGGFVEAVRTPTPTEGNNIVLHKFDSNRMLEWSEQYGDINNDHPLDLDLTSDGGYVISGFFGATATQGFGSEDLWLIKTHGDGSLDWDVLLGQTSEDEGFAVHETPDGGFVVAGFAENWDAPDGLGGRDMYLAKLMPTCESSVQRAYLKASNTETEDRFGYAMAISGDTIVVSARNEHSNATGIGGDQGNNGASGSGGAYVFVRDSRGNWSQEAYLKASNSAANDQFGESIAISGNTIVIGATGEDSNATGVNGDQSNNSFSASGAAYVFVRNGTSWSQEAYLKASNPDPNDQFGKSVAISGDTVVVAAWQEDSGTPGSQADNSASNAGAAYIFHHDGVGWTQQGYLKASAPDPTDNFGESVDISGDTVVIGVEGDDSAASCVNGNQSDNSATLAGAVYVFRRGIGDTWSQEAYLKASNSTSGYRFGASVGISGATVVVGSTGERSNATGVNGNQSDSSLNNPGAAYVFIRSSGGLWSQEAYLKSSNTGENDRLGGSVAISDDTIVLGSSEEDSSTTTIDGDQNDNSAPNAGAAYVFVRSGSLWSQASYIKASNAEAADFFARRLALSNETVIVGSTLEDSSATGLDGDQGNNSAPGAGAAYVFEIVCPPCRSIDITAPDSALPGTAFNVTGIACPGTFYIFCASAGNGPIGPILGLENAIFSLDHDFVLIGLGLTPANGNIASDGLIAPVGLMQAYSQAVTISAFNPISGVSVSNSVVTTF